LQQLGSRNFELSKFNVVEVAGELHKCCITFPRNAFDDVRDAAAEGFVAKRRAVKELLPIQFRKGSNGAPKA
jgi:hypothetical protein